MGGWAGLNCFFSLLFLFGRQGVGGRLADGVTGTCILALAMRRDFPPGQLPMETRFAFAASDMATYKDLYHVAQAIIETCQSEGSVRPGWVAAGEWGFSGGGGGEGDIG